MTTWRADHGRVTEGLVQYHENRARGGASLIVTEPVAALPSQAMPQRVRAWDDAEADGLRRWAAAVARHDCLLIGQIQDPGRGRHEKGRTPNAVGVSPLPDDLSWTVPRELEAGEIRRMIDDFADSAARLERCGFSGVELSCGHGHLFHQFMSPRSNIRDDEYGGSLENRVRLRRRDGARDPRPLRPRLRHRPQAARRRRRARRHRPDRGGSDHPPARRPRHDRLRGLLLGRALEHAGPAHPGHERAARAFRVHHPCAAPRMSRRAGDGARPDHRPGRGRRHPGARRCRLRRPRAAAGHGSGLAAEGARRARSGDSLLRVLQHLLGHDRREQAAGLRQQPARRAAGRSRLVAQARRAAPPRRRRRCRHRGPRSSLGRCRARPSGHGVRRRLRGRRQDASARAAAGRRASVEHLRLPAS
jgi:hypothetical protein